MFTLKLMIPLLIASSLSATEMHQVTYGWVEHGSILPSNTALDMKLDTGAESSSIDANNIELYIKNHKKWVKFNVDIKNKDTGETTSIPYDLPVARKVKISGAGGEDHRSVVNLDICMGGITLENEEFTLANRSNKIYPVLIGRNTLQHMGALVDSSSKYLKNGSCTKTKK